MHDFGLIKITSLQVKKKSLFDFVENCWDLVFTAKKVIHICHFYLHNNSKKQYFDLHITTIPTIHLNIVYCCSKLWVDICSCCSLSCPTWYLFYNFKRFSLKKSASLWSLQRDYKWSSHLLIRTAGALDDLAVLLKQEGVLLTNISTGTLPRFPPRTFRGTRNKKHSRRIFCEILVTSRRLLLGRWTEGNVLRRSWEVLLRRCHVAVAGSCWVAAAALAAVAAPGELLLTGGAEQLYLGNRVRHSWVVHRRRGMRHAGVVHGLRGVRHAVVHGVHLHVDVVGGLVVVVHLVAAPRVNMNRLSRLRPYRLNLGSGDA